MGCKMQAEGLRMCLVELSERLELSKLQHQLFFVIENTSYNLLALAEIEEMHRKLMLLL
jgi:hypothetical protein